MAGSGESPTYLNQQILKIKISWVLFLFQICAMRAKAQIAKYSYGTTPSWTLTTSLKGRLMTQ